MCFNTHCLLLLLNLGMLLYFLQESVYLRLLMIAHGKINCMGQITVWIIGFQPGLHGTLWFFQYSPVAPPELHKCYSIQPFSIHLCRFVNRGSSSHWNVFLGFQSSKELKTTRLSIEGNGSCTLEILCRPAFKN